MRIPSIARLIKAAAVAAALLVLMAGAVARAGSLEEYRGWVEEMKHSERGPFSQIRWFCKDGAVLPPKPYPCGERGGGYQHGELSERSRTLRAEGFRIANVLAGVDADPWLEDPGFADAFGQLLVEKFLILADDGWIFRRAQFYRGAIQEEDEREGAKDLLTAMAARPEWIGVRYAALRIGAQLLPHGEDTASVDRVRRLSTELAERDPGFERLRVKIHGTPAADDAAQVLAYAATVGDAELAAGFRELAGEIDRLYRPAPLEDLLEKNAAVFTRGPWLQTLLRKARSALVADPSSAGRFATTARLLADLREALAQVKSPAARLRVLDLSFAVETEHFKCATEIRGALPDVLRRGHLELLRSAGEAAYGAGLINHRLRGEMAKSLAALAPDALPLETYLRELRFLGLAPGWGAQQLRFLFAEPIGALARLEPLAEQFIQDRLRGSPLLFYSQVLDRLARDANRMAGVEHRLLERSIGAGVHALNPGLARGVLHAFPDTAQPAGLRADGIYILPETVADLPPVAGILTTGHGNPLSHVQLLARNLGIPNVAVDEWLLPELTQLDGRRIVLAVSPAGRVEIATDGERWDAVFGAAQGTSGEEVLIEPNLAKLDLSVREFVSLDRLRAADSGRIVGPKAATLGELKSIFPQAVPPGVAIPFGLFRQTVLDAPYHGSARTVTEWMVDGFRRLGSLQAGSAEARDFGEALRRELYGIIRETDPGPAFRKQLESAMQSAFGPGFSGGVFVRSDTNVEDLPGFTGAGLNLTRPNVVGLENVLNAIPEVWASPYTARAFAWRQSHMRAPEHVYPSVLLQRTVAAEISGVMVTQDIDSGERSVLSVAVNEGVGGAVDGQAAESLRVDTRLGTVRVLACATAPRRVVPVPSGGVARLAASGSETLLQPDEIRQLIALAQEIPRRFPALVDAAGKPAAADVEFAFAAGRLWLLQIRPFNESRRALGNAYLRGMDQAMEQRLGRTVNMREVMP